MKNPAAPFKPDKQAKQPEMRIETEVIRRYYVSDKHSLWIYGGPFETLEEANRCLADYKEFRKHEQD